MENRLATNDDYYASDWMPVEVGGQVDAHT